MTGQATGLTPREFALDVVEQLRAAGFQALWAGGCVRDFLLGGEPADYDVATSATPDEVRELFGFRRTLPIGVSFGVVVVLAARKTGIQVEVATFRTDASYSDGRRPDRVTFSTPEEDAKRRDFTINGMFYDPMKKKVIDYVNGEEDLRRGVIRAIGRAEDRISEDKLRMMRAVRFAARFGFAIDPKTRTAIKQCAEDVGMVSPERISVEVQKTLQTPRAAWAVSEWYQLGLLPTILPDVAAGWSRHRDRVVAMLDAIPTGTWQGKLSVLLFESVPAADHRGAAARLKLRQKQSNADSDTIRFALASQHVLDSGCELPWSRVQPQLIDPNVSTAVELLEARCAVGLDIRCLDWIRTRLSHPMDELNPNPLLVGADLIELGAKPGPRFKELLSSARSMQLDGELVDRQAAKTWAAEQLSNIPEIG